MLNNKFKKLLLTSSLVVATGAANAGYEINLSDDDKLSFGGYIKVDARYVDGDIAHSQYWAGSLLHPDAGEKKSQLNLNANETRFNMKYTHGDVMGFIEMDFYGAGTHGGANANEKISNSSNPRLRHAFIKYKNVVVGQTWSTFMNTSAIPESADFAGPAMGLVFIRQGQVRYTMGNFQVSLENPYTWGGDTKSDNVPDVVAKYNFKGDWGNVSVAGLARKLNVDANNTDTAIGYSVAGRIKTVGKDDLRFQLHGGNVGRYVGVGSSVDVDNTGNEAEETVAYIVAYRHFWSEDLRTTVAYANSKADTTDIESTQWSVNLFKNLTKQLSVGVEVGNFSRDDQNADSDYAQISLKYVL
ncbi:MAG: hypothetical protein JKX76_11350 [Colwellia sp.]|nr:hypothetical protein [Colwellia sp.]